MKDTMSPEEQKKANLRMALILGSIAVVLFIGFMVKQFMLGH